MRSLAVVPTYQEAANISALLQRIRAAAPDVDVLVVDDGSPDGTAELAEELALATGGVHVLRRQRKQGLGPAYQAGFSWGFERGYDVLVGMDADLSHDPSALPELLAAIGDGADMVLGSRYVPGGSIPDWPLRRRALSRWGNRYATIALGLGVHDATSGYRAYRAETLKTIPLRKARASGYGFQIELVYRMVRSGARVTEVPIAFVDRQEGESKMSSSIIMEAFALVTAWAARDHARRLGAGLTRRWRSSTW